MRPGSSATITRGLSTAIIVLLAIVSTGCGGDDVAFTDEAGTQKVDGLVEVLDDESPTPMERYESGDLTFGDPKADGYAAVEDRTIEPVELTPEEQQVPAPDAVAPPAARAPAEADAANGESTEAQGTELLSTVEPIDAAPDASTVGAADDGRPRNEVGELITLDDAASVACGNVEIAVTELDQGNTAAADERLAIASDLAASSKTAGMTAWAQQLKVGTNAGPAQLIGFLTACSEGGYEL